MFVIQRQIYTGISREITLCIRDACDKPMINQSRAKKKKNCENNLFNTTRYHMPYISIHKCCTIFQIRLPREKSVESGELDDVV